VKDYNPELGYRSVKWSVKAMYKSEYGNFVAFNNRIRYETGTLFKFTFNITSGYDTQYYQVSRDHC